MPPMDLGSSGLLQKLQLLQQKSFGVYFSNYNVIVLLPGSRYKDNGSDCMEWTFYWLLLRRPPRNAAVTSDTWPTLNHALCWYTFSGDISGDDSKCRG